MEFLERGGGYTWLALLAISLAWTSAVLRTSLIDRDYGAAPAGGWLLLGGALAICLAGATLVPPHTSVLMTVYAGLGPPLLLIISFLTYMLLQASGGDFFNRLEEDPKVSQDYVMALRASA